MFEAEEQKQRDMIKDHTPRINRNREQLEGKAGRETFAAIFLKSLSLFM